MMMSEWEKIMAGKIKYDKCISLGWFCGTALAMGYYGLRSHSGPFDWFFSDFEGVLKVMETDFSDFMKKENLVLDEGDDKTFYDMKYGFHCNHDISDDFEMEYPMIYQKYMRRVEHFQQDVKNPTCFIRAVKSEKEIQFIEENQEYISKVIARGNQNSQIIFLTFKKMKNISDQYRFLSFRLDMMEYIGKIYEMRTMFDSSASFVRYCQNCILSEDIRKRNIEFDREHLSEEKRFSILINKLGEEKCDILPVLKKYYPDIDSGIFLFGGGYCGGTMLRYLCKNNVLVRAVIDNDSGKTGFLLGGVPVISFSEVEQYNPNIFIAVRSNEIADEILNQIIRKLPNAIVYKMQDLLCHSEILSKL